MTRLQTSAWPPSAGHHRFAPSGMEVDSLQTWTEKWKQTEKRFQDIVMLKPSEDFVRLASVSRFHPAALWLAPMIGREMNGVWL